MRSLRSRVDTGAVATHHEGMRALRRVATPVVVLLSGCAFPVDEFKEPAKSDAGLTTNADGAVECVCVREAGPNCKEWSPAGCKK